MSNYQTEDEYDRQSLKIGLGIGTAFVLLPTLIALVVAHSIVPDHKGLEKRIPQRANPANIYLTPAMGSSVTNYVPQR